MLLGSNWQDSRSQNVVINPKSTEHRRGDATENGKDELGINQEQVFQEKESFDAIVLTLVESCLKYYVMFRSLTAIKGVKLY